MKKLVIFGFEPFGGESINPSLEVALRLPEVIGEYKIISHRLPVVFGEAADMAMDIAEREDADVLICLGQAGGREHITPELVAINLRNADIPDNKGNHPKDEPVVSGGREAYFSSLPVRKMAEAMAERGIPARLSYSAGAYVCNDLYYSLLHRFFGTKRRVCFIHVPYCTDQGRTPSMELDRIVEGIRVAIEAI